ncbi:Mobile element protein (plasmid) [Rhodococcus sp. WAY2]|nr:Mobile element protein [Rhodococcus sp. WAY2]
MALIAAGYQVFAINPLQVARYRERHTVAGAKSDARERTHAGGYGAYRLASAPTCGRRQQPRRSDQG